MITKTKAGGHTWQPLTHDGKFIEVTMGELEKITKPYCSETPKYKI